MKKKKKKKKKIIKERSTTTNCQTLKMADVQLVNFNCIYTAPPKLNH